MRSIVGVTAGIMMWLSMWGVGFAEEYLGVQGKVYSAALQLFDQKAPGPGAKEFVRTNHGMIVPDEMVTTAMEKGWDVIFSEKEIGQGTLLIFLGKEYEGTFFVASKTPEGIHLTAYTGEGDEVSLTVQSLAELEEKIGVKFMAGIQPSKRQVRWVSSEPYSSRYPAGHISYIFNLYTTYSGSLQLNTEREWDKLVDSMERSHMPKTVKPGEVTTGSLVMTKNKWMFFIMHVDEKNDYIYITTYFEEKGGKFIKIVSRQWLQKTMMFAILPQKKISGPILF